MRLQRFGLGTMLAAALGTALGAGLLYSRSVTGVASWTIYGAVSGAFLGAALAAGAIRSITWVTTSLGAILPAATLHLNACDGSVFVVPMAGALCGLIVGAAVSAGLPRRLMRGPRARFTVRRMMVAVAIVALVLAWFHMRIGVVRDSYEDESQRYAALEELARDGGVIQSNHGAVTITPDARGAAHFARMRRRYERAARYPWLPVAPDPPPS